MAILAGKTVLVSGILTERSIACSVARCAIDEGAVVIATSAPSTIKTTARALRGLASTPLLLELDATSDESIDHCAQQVLREVDHLDGLLHAIGGAPRACLGAGMLTATRDEVASAIDVSAVSLAAMARSFAPLLAASSTHEGGSIVGLDFDASRAWPAYDWMGVAKAAYESLTRYLARELGPHGIRVNLVAAGPIRTAAARSIPGFGPLAAMWEQRAPLGWDIDDPTPVGRAVVALFSKYFAATTGAIIHVDGGVHAQGG